MRTSTILSVPVMAACVLLAFLPQGTPGRSEIPLVVAGVLFLRLVLEAVRVWRVTGWTGPRLEACVPEGRRLGRLRMELRMLLMIWMLFAALVAVVGFTIVWEDAFRLAFVSRAACAAAVGMVAAGHVVLRGKPAWTRALGLLFLLLNLMPVGLALMLIGSTLRGMWWLWRW